MIWTADQKTAIDKAEEWSKLDIYSHTGNNLFVLQGAAGTGKSTVVKEIIARLKGKKIMVSAPTHKAKEVISMMTGKPGVTLHSLLGLRPNIELDDYNPHNPIYHPLSEQYMNKADIHIIDECSMINKALFKSLVDEAEKHKVRLFFVGDKLQLPPVKESISLAFLIEHSFELKEIVRQKGDNPNQELLTALRADAENNSNLLQVFVNNDESTINQDKYGCDQGYDIQASKEGFYSRLIELYSDSEFKVDINFMKTLTYTNNAAKKINRYVKSKINPDSEIISEGDYMLGYKTFLGSRDRVLVQNSKDYRLQSVEIVTKSIRMKEYKFFKAVLNLDTKEDIYILHPDSYDDFYEIMLHLYQNAMMKRGWRPFYAFKENFIIMEDFKLPESDKYLIKKDIDLGYAMTIHKSQGSTYKNVATLYNNINICRVEKDRKRLAYVAMSRCTNLNLIGALPE